MNKLNINDSNILIVGKDVSKDDLLRNMKDYVIDYNTIKEKYGINIKL